VLRYLSSPLSCMCLLYTYSRSPLLISLTYISNIRFFEKKYKFLFFFKLKSTFFGSPNFFSSFHQRSSKPRGFINKYAPKRFEVVTLCSRTLKVIAIEHKKQRIFIKHGGPVSNTKWDETKNKFVASWVYIT
jgi:hypothetical protein